MHYLKLVYNKKYFNLKKIFILKLFKMAANQTAICHQISIGREVQTMLNSYKNE